MSNTWDSLYIAMFYQLLTKGIFALAVPGRLVMVTQESFYHILLTNTTIFVLLHFHQRKIFNAPFNLSAKIFSSFCILAVMTNSQPSPAPQMSQPLEV